MTDRPRATVYTDERGQLVLDDPEGLAVLRVVQKHNCRLTLDLFPDRVAHFKERLAVLGNDRALVVMNVDDPQGRFLADLAMPGHDWTADSADGKTPYARGLMFREALAEWLDTWDVDAAQKMRTCLGPVVLVVDYGVAEVFHL